jgi:hypothetical protein
MRGPSHELHCELDENMWDRVLEADDPAESSAVIDLEIASVKVYANKMELELETGPGDPHTTPEVAQRRHEASIFCAEVIRSGACPLYAYRERKPGGSKTVVRKNNGGNGERLLRIVS